MEREYLKQRIMLAVFGTFLLWMIGILNVLLNDDIKPVFSTSATGQEINEISETDKQEKNPRQEDKEYEKQLYQMMLEEQSDDAIPIVYIEEAPLIRVLLKDSDFSGRVHEEVEITSDGSFSVNFTYKSQNTEVFYGAGEVVNIDKYDAWFEEGNIRINSYGGTLQILSLEREYGTPSYEGILEIKREKEGYYLINEVPLETYLRYVVPSEMPSGYPKEALKAQAICARTYAYQFVQNPGLPKFDANLDDSVSYQVYNNIPPQESTDEAIEETRGQLLSYKDKLAETFFYSTSCGFGTDISVWNANSEKYPYLQAKNHGEVKLSGVETLSSAMPYDVPTGEEMQMEEVFVNYINQVCEGDFEAGLPWYRWNYTVDKLDIEKLEKNLKEKYEDKPELVLTLNANGVFESKKIGDIKKIKNIWISSRRPGGAACGLCIETEDTTYQILTENAIRSVLCDGDTKVVNGDGKKVSFPNLLPSAFFAISTSKEGENVVGYKVIGGGYGHGIGMSQNGASQMAKSGYSAVQILQHFFEGTQIKQVY